MNKPKYAQWAAECEIKPISPAPFPFLLSMEKESTFSEIYEKSNWKKKILFKLVGLFGYVPSLAFQKEDVDMEIVEKMLKHKDLLEAVDTWISVTDYTVLDKLVEAKRVFEAIQKPPRHQHLYRGFNINHGQQNAGIAEHYKKMKVGDKWAYTPDKPLSFSWHEGTTHAYGNIIVSAEFGKISKSCLHITHEMIMAIFKMDGKWDPEDEFYMFTYAESVFLPNEKPIELTLVSKG